MNTAAPRPSIPDAWEEKASCPLCAAQGMKIVRVQNQPDQMRCNTCGLAFELESNGPRMHVTRWPAILEELDGITEDWLAVNELRGLAQKVTASPVLPRPVQQAIPVPAPAPVEEKASTPQPVQGPARPAKAAVSDEIVVRIKKLRDLGNSPAQIRRILMQEGKSAAEIDAATLLADRMEKQDQSRQQKKLWRSLGVTAIILLVCIGSGAILVNLFSKNKPAVVAAAQATLAPDIAEALHINTPVVEYAANPPPAASAITGCPQNAAQAEMLFGGSAANWTFPPGSNGWVMIDPAKGHTIYVPENMTAAYMQLGDAITLVEVYGPASMQDVYYIAISCP